jgi:ABC-2 type transport system ATP-binding protein
MTAHVAVVDLAKIYGAHRAVDGVSFQAPRGGIYGILGPNGAGKSSTLRMLVGVLQPTSGVVLVDGAPITRAAQRRIGYLPEERGLYRTMTPRAIIAYYARLKGVKAGEARRRARRLLEEHGLGPWGKKKIKALSKGMAQKVQLLAALAHEPDVMVLDEPFSGLDPVNQASLEALIRAQAAAGRTVIFSTHVMEHAERLCERILLIAKGKARFEGTVADALALAPRTAVVETDGGFDFRAVAGGAGFLAEDDGAAPMGGRRWRVDLADTEAARRLLTAAVQAGAPLRAFEPARASLHDVFVSLVGAADAPPQTETADA